MKKLGFVLILITLVISSCGGAQDKASEQTPSAETALDRLLEESNKTTDVSDYPTVLEKWQKGLDQARTLDNKHYIYQFLNLIGGVYGRLG